VADRQERRDEETHPTAAYSIFLSVKITSLLNLLLDTITTRSDFSDSKCINAFGKGAQGEHTALPYMGEVWFLGLGANPPIPFTPFLPPPSP